MEYKIGFMFCKHLMKKIIVTDIPIYMFDKLIDLTNRE